MARAGHACCGIVSDSVRARRTQANKPQPWITRKLAVGITVLLVGYSSYVYAGRFCRDMIVRSSSALGNQAIGVAFLVVFCLLLFLMSWCYLAVVMTSPGHARQHTQTTTRPGYDNADRSSTRNSNELRGTSYELMSPTPNASNPPTQESARKHNLQSSIGSRRSKTVASQASFPASSVAKPEQQSSHSQASTRSPEEARASDGFGPPESSQDSATLPTHVQPHQSGQFLPPPIFTRRPTTTPVLLPEYRYCSKCQIVKPSRTHHCRTCGTCVLKYDHHCPWIGQCVGAFNQKFFINFLEWAMVLCLWTFGTLLGLTVRPHNFSASGLDPQQIVVTALAGFFGIFCALILFVQVYLVLRNQTTVESLNYRSMREREQELLSQMHKWYQFGAKRRTRKQWDDEWGRIGIEGNLWWLGSRRANWEAVMGRNAWRWFLPIGRPLDDGMNYATNPRFDSAGRWKRRKEWPSDLQ